MAKEHAYHHNIVILILIIMSASLFTLVSVSGAVSCKTIKFISGSVSNSNLKPGDKYTLLCNYGSIVDCIAPVAPSGSCSFAGWSGTSAKFSCTAGSTGGSVSCVTFSGSSSNCCASSNKIGTINVAGCGNGILDTGEACDGASFGTIKNCTYYPEFSGGTLKCSSTCQLDTSSCVKKPICGNGILESGESCDDGNLIGGDGCSSICAIEAAPLPPSPQEPSCKASNPSEFQQCITAQAYDIEVTKIIECSGPNACKFTLKKFTHPVTIYGSSNVLSGFRRIDHYNYTILNLRNLNGVTLKNLIFDETTAYCKATDWVNCHSTIGGSNLSNLVIENLTVAHSKAFDIALGESTNVTIKNSNFIDSGVGAVWLANSPLSVNRFVHIKNNLFTDSNTGAVLFSAYGTAASPNTLKKNIITHNHRTYKVFNSPGGQVVIHVNHNSIVENNAIINGNIDDGATLGYYASGIEFSDDLRDVIIQSNDVHNNSGSGIAILDYARNLSNIILQNNKLYSNGQPGWPNPDITYTATDPVTIANNCFAADCALKVKLGKMYIIPDLCPTGQNCTASVGWATNDFKTVTLKANDVVVGSSQIGSVPVSISTNKVRLELYGDGALIESRTTSLAAPPAENISIIIPPSDSTIKIKRVGSNLSDFTAAQTSGWIDALPPNTANPAVFQSIAAGTHTAYTSAVSGYTVRAGTCNKTILVAGECSVTNFPLIPTCTATSCSIPIFVGANELTKAVFQYTPISSVPSDQFLWGFNFIAGTGNDPKNKKGKLLSSNQWNISDNDLISLRDDMGINTIRFFIHPQFVGLPQKTWSGLESFDYTKFPDNSYNWTKLDKAINQTTSLGITPILLPLVVDEYLGWIYKDDLTFLNNMSSGLDYTGIVPKNQIKAYSTAIAKHVAEKFPALKFYIVFAEVCGRGLEGAPLRTSEMQAWQSITSSIHQVAPNAVVFSPELCVAMWWWPTAQANGCKNYDPVYYDQNWPRGDYLENYAKAADIPAIAFSGITQVDNQNFCPAEPRIKSTLDTVNTIVRDHIGSKQFLWSEVGWGNDNDAGCTTEDTYLSLASMLFADNMRGAIVWHGKEIQASSTFTYKCAPIDFNGNHLASYDHLAKIGKIVRNESAFLSTYHTLKNSDNIPIASDLFKESDSEVFTRYLTDYLVIYNSGLSAKKVIFANTGNYTLEEFLNTANASIVISKTSSGIDVSNIQPKKLYALKVIKQSALPLPICQALTFVGGSINPSNVILNGSFTISCDYGKIIDCVSTVLPSGSCKYTGLSGTSANFNCTAGIQGGTVSCNTFSGTPSNCCQQSNNVGTINVAGCGNGIIGTGETCDGTAFGAIDSCTDYPEFSGGTLKCTSSCQLDTSSCIKKPVCGNGILESGEACDDGNKINGDGCSSSCTKEVAQCKTLNFIGGNINPTKVGPGQTFTLSCNFGTVIDCIAPVTPSGTCQYTGFSGTSANFKCTLGNTGGEVRCNTFAGTASKCCATSYQVATI